MYKLSKSPTGNDVIIKTNDDGSVTSMLKVETDPNYQTYLAWLAEGNTPLPADEPKE
jgi:hypothetical protein